MIAAASNVNKTAESKTRVEYDTFGEVLVPAHRYYGAQTARSLKNFRIGDELEEQMPFPIIRAFGIFKKAAAEVNCEFGLDPTIARAISQASDEVVSGQFDDDFPLVIWQTGSGTQTNMNANEVIANRAIELLHGQIGSKQPVHPNDHVNMSQSTNDAFPTVMHIAVMCDLNVNMVPSIQKLIETFEKKAKQLKNIYLHNATANIPLNFGDLFNEFAKLLSADLQCCLQKAMPRLLVLAAGGTAVGTGLNAPQGFAEKMADRIAELTGYPFKTAPNKFEALAAHDAMVECHAALNMLALALMQIATKLHEIDYSATSAYQIIDAESAENEESDRFSEYVPKMRVEIDVTHCEMLAMLAAQVVGNHTSVTVGGSNGHFELNTFKPLIVSNVLQSTKLIADCCDAFRVNCIDCIRIVKAFPDTTNCNDKNINQSNHAHINSRSFVPIHKIPMLK